MTPNGGGGGGGFRPDPSRGSFVLGPFAAMAAAESLDREGFRHDGAFGDPDPPDFPLYQLSVGAEVLVLVVSFIMQFSYYAYRCAPRSSLRRRRRRLFATVCTPLTPSMCHSVSPQIFQNACVGAAGCSRRQCDRRGQ